MSSSPGSRRLLKGDVLPEVPDSGAAAAPGTHTAMAHDDPTTKNYTLARRLAALVIQDLGPDVLAVMNAPEPARPQLMKERVVAKVIRYLRPPDSGATGDEHGAALVAGAQITGRF